MFGLTEICLLAAAAACVLARFLPWLRAYRALFRGGAALLLISAVFPRTGNPLGQFLFGRTGHGLRLPPGLFAVAWWVLGAWLGRRCSISCCGGRCFPTTTSRTPGACSPTSPRC